MINKQLLNPKNIVVIGGSNNVHKPGGKVLKNLLAGNFKGEIYVTNLKENEVQGIKSYKKPEDLPQVDLAIIAIAAPYCPAVVEVLAQQKNTRAFIILSAGFSEVGIEGKLLETKIVETVNSVNGALIGPNGIGVLTPNYNGVFTEPIPKLSPQGIDFISGSGATAVFILESGIPQGLSFSTIFSVGNSAQIGVEEVLKYMDENFDSEASSKIKLLYMERIDKPKMFLKHASSLIRKGCKIAAIKAGSSSAGSRAASSHTGALASSDTAVDALFRKAGVVRCSGREELVSVASVFMYPELKGKNIAVITHAGGPAVMLTDELSRNGLQVPQIKNEYSRFLLDELFPGSSVANPIDFLATGTAEQLDTIINYVDNKFDEIDGMAVVFGTPGLVKVFDAYEVIHKRLQTSQKPIFPILPSTKTAKAEIDEFLKKGNSFFADEVVLGRALGKVYNTPKPAEEAADLPLIDVAAVQKIIHASENGYLPPESVQQLLDAAGISRAKEAVSSDVKEACLLAKEITYPLVMKVVGPVHKSDVGGVILNVKTEEDLKIHFEKLMQIPNAEAVLMQPMLSGTELFAGAKYEKNFGHLILAGLGGIFIEVLKDVNSELSPLSSKMAFRMIRSLKSYKIIEGVRGQAGINEVQFVDILSRISALVEAAPEIQEMDLNPLLGTAETVIAVDARIRVEK